MEYSYSDLMYPHFYPVEDEMNPGTFLVEFSLTCYPYARGSEFDIEAFPPALRGLAQNGNTKFYFIARDFEGKLCEGLDEIDAVSLADDLNDAFHDAIYDASETWDWDNLEYEIDFNDAIYWK